MNNLNEFLKNSWRYGGIEETILGLEKEKAVLESTQSNLSDKVFAETYFEKLGIGKGKKSVFKDIQNGIYILPEIGNDRVWIRPENEEEFMRYLTSAEYDEKNIGKSGRGINVIFSVVGGYVGIGLYTLSMTLLSTTPIGKEITEIANSSLGESLKFSLTCGLPAMFGLVGGSITYSLTDAKNLKESRERHDRYVPDYEGVEALKFLSQNYETNNIGESQ